MPTKKKTVKKKKTTGRTKKVAAKKTAEKDVLKAPVQEPEAPLTPAEIDHFAEQLLVKRRQLLGDVDQMEGKNPDGTKSSSSGDLSNMPIHMADIGTDNYEQEFTLGLIESERNLLRQIDLALLKVERGTYGIGEVTGSPIGRARLQAKPWARYCIEYARKMEKGLVHDIPLEDAVDASNEEIQELSEDSA